MFLVNAEEQVGGLAVVRPSSTRPSSAQGNYALHIQPIPATEARATSRPPPDDVQASVAGPSHPPAKKLKSDDPTAPRKRQGGKGKDSEVYPGVRDEPEVDEDVRQMQSEAASLRRQSQVAERSIVSGNINPAFQFPMSAHKPSQAPVLQPLSMDESPAIERNRFMRGEVPHRRRSSVSRGKRASTSYENTGTICEHILGRSSYSLGYSLIV